VVQTGALTLKARLSGLSNPRAADGWSIVDCFREGRAGRVHRINPQPASVIIVGIGAVEIALVIRQVHEHLQICDHVIERRRWAASAATFRSATLA